MIFWLMNDRLGSNWVDWLANFLVNEYNYKKNKFGTIGSWRYHQFSNRTLVLSLDPIAPGPNIFFDPNNSLYFIILQFYIWTMYC